jgi:hypothetical protein
MVLRMLTVADPEVGYVQGMNLLAGVVVSHIKEVQLSYLFVREVMKYGHLRSLYLPNFKPLLELCHNLLHRHLKLLISDLYEVLQEANIIAELFMPFYLSLFACVVDYPFMVPP